MNFFAILIIVVILICSCNNKSNIEQEVKNLDTLKMTKKSVENNEMDSFFQSNFKKIKINDTIISYINKNELLLKEIKNDRFNVLNSFSDSSNIINKNIYFYTYFNHKDFIINIELFRKILYDINKKSYIDSKDVTHKFLFVKDTIIYFDKKKIDVYIFEDEKYYANFGIKCYPTIFNIKEDERIFVFYFDNFKFNSKLFLFEKEVKNHLLEYKFIYLSEKKNFKFIDYTKVDYLGE